MGIPSAVRPRMSSITPTVSTDAHDRAEELHQQAMDAGDEDRALALYMQALALDFGRADTHYNVGLIYKYRGDWEKSRRFNKRAAELQPDHEAANWNLAIAATALRDWPTARAAWKRVGIDVGDGDGPIDGHFGHTPVRLNPHEDPEVVWGRRICPVRVRVENIPFPESGFGFGDVVLHDGAATGYKIDNGVEKPIFNVFETFQASRHTTFMADVAIASENDVVALRDACRQADVEFEDWTHSVRYICRGCSEGTTHDTHERIEDPEWAHRRRVGFAAVDEADVRAVLEQWQDGARRVESFEVALEGDEDA